MKGIKITVIMLIFCQAAVAQTKTAQQIAAKQVEKLDSKVALSDIQKEQVSEVLLASTQQIMELRESEKLTPEIRKELKKEERTKVKEILTQEQQLKLKEARLKKEEYTSSKEVHKANRAKRKAAKTELLLKRKDFDVVLTADEKAIISQARAMKPAKLEGKEAKENLSEEDKQVRKLAMKEIHQLLKPIVQAHQVELKEIKASIPEKDAKEGKTSKKNRKGFAYKFLLME